jgi:membrane protease YdiL (CAAX protease family)
MAFPSHFTWVYFVALADSAPWAQQAAWLIGKGIQFAFPLAWVFLIERQRPRWSKLTSRGLALGVGIGALIAVVMLAAYHGWLFHTALFAHVADVLRKKLPAFGINGPAAMIALGVFYSAIHSLMEEYYWRWFVFGQLRCLVPQPVAILVSSLAFMGHHVVVLLIYLPWPWAAAASACVAVGGAIWAWLYQRSGSLYAPWLCHLLIDAAIFAIGYDLVFTVR